MWGGLIEFDCCEAYVYFLHLLCWDKGWSFPSVYIFLIYSLMDFVNYDISTPFHGDRMYHRVSSPTWGCATGKISRVRITVVQKWIDAVFTKASYLWVTHGRWQGCDTNTPTPEPCLSYHAMSQLPAPALPNTNHCEIFVFSSSAQSPQYFFHQL